MRFSIRDLMLMTVIVALVLGWGLDRRIVVSRAREASNRAANELASHKALAKALTQQLRSKNPAATIEINVHGNGSTTTTIHGVPNSAAPAPKPPQP